jgi:hypothetical protein
MKNLERLSYAEQQEITAMQAAFKEAGCVFEFAVFRVTNAATDQTALHKEALDRLCLQNNQNAAENHKRLVAMYPSMAKEPPFGCEYKTELAAPIAVKLELVPALLEMKPWEVGEHFYSAFFQSFMKPPYGTKWDDAQATAVFQQWTEMIGLALVDQPQILDWVANPYRASVKGFYPEEPERCAWSNYFRDGLEWWGVWCFTILNPKKQTLAAVMASATD